MAISYEFVLCESYKNVRLLEKIVSEAPPTNLIVTGAKANRTTTFELVTS